MAGTADVEASKVRLFAIVIDSDARATADLPVGNYGQLLMAAPLLVRSADGSPNSDIFYITVRVSL
jgi:hypothetical protein